MPRMGLRDRRKVPHLFITAGQIATTGDIEVMNPDLVICHLGTRSSAAAPRA